VEVGADGVYAGEVLGHEVHIIDHDPEPLLN
jgi:hypothetical protein